MKQKSFKEFNLKKRLEEIELQHYPIIFPGVGDTGQWLKIRSQHCTEFREADIKAQRQISALVMAQGGDFEKVDRDLIEDIRMRAFCNLIAEWSFEEECNTDNVMEFLKNNQFIYDDVNNLAAQDSLFFSSPAKD